MKKVYWRPRAVSRPALLLITLWGAVAENGEGKGKGYNVNIPLPPGSGPGAYALAFEKVVIPALMRFKPDLIVVPSGFDASGVDPMGRMTPPATCAVDAS